MDFFLALRVLYDIVLGATCLIAFRLGGRAERIGAAIFVIGSFATLAVQQLPFFDWRFERSGLLIVDVLALMAIFALAQRSNRFWPLWATACHLIAVTTHVVMLLEPRHVLQAYAIAQGFWTYPVLMAIIIGSIGRHRRRRRQRKLVP